MSDYVKVIRLTLYSLLVLWIIYHLFTAVPEALMEGSKEFAPLDSLVYRMIHADKD